MKLISACVNPTKPNLVEIYCTVWELRNAEGRTKVIVEGYVHFRTHRYCGEEQYVRLNKCPSRLTELGAQNTLANSPKKIYQHLDNSDVS